MVVRILIHTALNLNLVIDNICTIYCVINLFNTYIDVVYMVLTIMVIKATDWFNQEEIYIHICVCVF